MPKILLKQALRELIGIGQVAVMGEDNTVRRIDVKGLGFRTGARPGGGVTAMTDTHIPHQPLDIFLLENIPDQAIGLVSVEAGLLITGRNTGRILAAVLNHPERIIHLDRGLDFPGGNNANDSTHGNSDKLRV
jgi:hypothetical protein